MERGEDAARPGDPEAGDDALICRIRAGDDAAYETLYERHLPAARRLASQLAGRDAADAAVHDAFAKVLAVLKLGGGPDSGFRPYLLTAVRRAALDRQRAGRHAHRTGDTGAHDTGELFDDPAAEEFERSAVARAFLTLPERWQTALWYTEVEDAKPAEVAPILGLDAVDAAALARRARDGLRQAYLRMRLEELEAEDGCRPVLAKLGDYVRDVLPHRDSRRVKRHLGRCKRCRGLHGELAQVNTALRDLVGPLVLGSASTAYLPPRGGLFPWSWRSPRRQRMFAAAAVAVAGAAALGLALVSGEQPSRVRPAPPPAAGPAAPRPPAAAPPAAKAPAAKQQAAPHVFVRAVAAAPRIRPSRPAPKPRPEPRPHAAPPEDEPSVPRPTPPAPVKMQETPGGLLVHIEMRVPLTHTEVRVRFDIDMPDCETRFIWHRTSQWHRPVHRAPRPFTAATGS
ncbi:sigma-70 family RNA polymerase sigma factor [Actinomadura sp. WMMA1423]|uniref:sigma-70 family RNA polymerase sigma factor n=1 Tax=Actinomadura sp. WMMA1423 TaxID=2591108 RepID=UPI0011461BCF|nr:sigma-70 family RNA polymerase sigma factor [Actinomadura sp. WMMA1423]